MQKNIFRCIITFPFFPLDESTSITATYEREIKRPFTFVLQAGPSFSIHKFGTSNNPYQSSINAFASGEFRYYFNLNRRIKKGKLVKNFSTNYFSLQQYVVTNPLLIINDSRAFYGNSSSFINVGWQKQNKRFYLNLFLGMRLVGNDFGKYNRTFETLHGGASLGYVFK